MAPRPWFDYERREMTTATTTPMRVLGLSGSVRRDSHNRKLLQAAAGVLPEGIELIEWSALSELPIYDEDLEAESPEPVAGFLEALEGADAVLVATPEYNASVPGGLKNALDWASRPFPDNALRGKPAAVVGASTGLFGAVWAQAEVRKILGAMGAHVLDAERPVGLADAAFGDDGRLADPDLAARLEEIVASLAAEMPAPAPVA